MVFGTENALDVADFNDTTSVLVKLKEGFLNDVLTIGVHITYDTAHKFIVIDFTITVQVKQVKKFATFLS
jgi:hypothetical protein